MDKLYYLYKKIRDKNATDEEKIEFEHLKSICCIDPIKLEIILLNKYFQEQKEH